MKKILRISSYVLIFGAIAFYLIITRTNIQIAGIEGNKVLVPVLKADVGRGDKITADNIKMEKKEKDSLLSDIVMDKNDLADSNGNSLYVAKQPLYKGEQIMKVKIISKSDFNSNKQDLYAVPVEYVDSTIANSLRKGDVVSVWARQKEQKPIEVLKSVSIYKLKNSDGVEVNSAPDNIAIPTAAVLRLNSDDIEILEYYKSQGSTFFFTKSVLDDNN